jgi:hypothetical protein
MSFDVLMPFDVLMSFDVQNVQPISQKPSIIILLRQTACLCTYPECEAAVIQLQIVSEGFSHVRPKSAPLLLLLQTLMKFKVDE